MLVDTLSRWRLNADGPCSSRPLLRRSTCQQPSLSSLTLSQAAGPRPAFTGRANRVSRPMLWLCCLAKPTKMQLSPTIACCTRRALQTVRLRDVCVLIGRSRMFLMPPLLKRGTPWQALPVL